MSNPTLDQFEADIKELLAAGLKGMKVAIESNGGILDEKSFRALEILNKCVTEIGKRLPKDGGNKYAEASIEELSSDFD